MNLIISKLIIPLVLIGAITTVIVIVLPHFYNTAVQSATYQAEKRIQDTRSADRRYLQSKLDTISSDKATLYVIMIGSLLALVIIGFNVISLILRLPNQYLLYPDKFAIISHNEAEALQYIKYRLIDANITKSETICSKEDVMRLLER